MVNKCKFCNKDFGSDTALMQHFDGVHKTDKGSLGVNEVRKRGISSTILIIAGILCCGLPVLLIGVGGIGIFSFLNPQHPQTSGIAVGEVAPNIPITLANGTNISLSNLRGKPVVLWFMTTWCTSCQEGANLLANSGYYSKIHAKGADIVTIELYNDLGYAGPSIQNFANQYGNGTQNNGWLYGTSSFNATYLYDPKGYLDVYYIINSSGTITSAAPGLPSNLDNIAEGI